jgi:branched-chain amino acid transport system permease protein
MFIRYRYTLLTLAVVALLPLFLRSGSLATEILIFGMAALGCNLLLGYTGLMSFGQGIFFGLGSYTAGWLLLHLHAPLPIALLGCAGAGAVIAGVVGGFAIRQRGVYFVMLTLAFAQMFYFLAYTMKAWTGGDNGLLDIPRPPLAVFGSVLRLDTPWRYYAFVAVVFVVVFAILQRVADSILGRTLRAIRDNPARATAVGYDIKVFKTVAFIVSGAVTGLAGGEHALLTGLAPLSNIDYQMSETILIITVIGGTGKLFASIVGSIFYVLAADWLSTLWPRWLMLLGFLLIAISLYMQKGLWGVLERVGALLRRAAREPRRETLRVPEEEA